MQENKEYEELYVNGETFKTHFSKKYKEKPKWQKENNKLIYAFIPGTIYDIYVEEGQDIKKGEVLVILEAMKMRNRVKSEISGKIKSINVKKNQLVAKNFLLIELY